jgi:3-oxoacyl-[acyl-carrier protein] reductase
MDHVRTALVTGSAKGLGRAIALELAAAGMEIVLADKEDMTEAAAAIEALGRRARAVDCDVAEPESVEQLRAAVEAAGGCDVLVNNAGIYPFVLFEDLDYAAWRRIQAINLDGVYLTCRAFLPTMKARGWGRVVNIASNSFMNGTDPMLTGYVSSKGGVIGLTRALASEYGPHGITANVVAPGLLVTDTTVAAVGGRPGDPGADKWAHMISLQSVKRAGTPADVVGAVRFLTSDAASYITAQTLVVDGGLARL